ncbi:MAG: hypothetical protein R6W06_05955 [Prochlorococcaceae cyanobacterium]
MARLEALIQPITGGPERDLAMERLAERLGGEFFGLDARNAAITLTAGPGDLPMQVLLEWRPPEQLVVLLKSRERTGSGAPLSRAVLDQVLEALLQAAGGARVLFRSDRDGPVRQVA